MSKTEKYLPFILSFSLPWLNVIDQLPGEHLDWTAIIPRYLLISSFLFSLWHFNRYLVPLLDQLTLRFLGPRLAIVLLNGGYILIFLGVDTFLLPDFISLHKQMHPWLIAFRLAIAALMFGMFQQSLRAVKQKEALKIQNLSLQAENLKAQLETMKQQINPHFLFNSLNTLLDFIEEDQKKAESFVRSFSNLYRIVLQSSKRDFVSLKDELDFMKNYWCLMKMRFNDALELRIDISKDIESYLIPPLSLQFLIENAVKHNLATQDKVLRIEITEFQNSLVVQNRIIPKPYKEFGEGVGLKNLQKRFSLLHRPIHYGVEGDLFKVTLPLKSI